VIVDGFGIVFEIVRWLVCDGLVVVFVECDGKLFLVG